ncbi:MAG: ABC transporter permease [Allorhizobium sp.]
MSSFRTRLSIAFRLALREMRGGLGGFYIFLACIALGTGAIAAVNSISQSITDSITTQGKSILAGDIRFELNNREATTAELAYLTRLGDVAVNTNLRSMARRADGSDQSLVEVKAVDAAYPLYGTFAAEPALPLAQLLEKKGDAFGAVAAPLLLDRLGLVLGDEILIGNAKIRVTGTIVNEPDAISEGFGLAPRLLTSREALQATGLIQTGSLVETAYKIRFSDNNLKVADVAKAVQADLPNAGWSVRTSERAAPSLSESINRFSQFLTLVGLTALIVGGVGVANAVRAFLDSKRTVIATLKCLGAPASVVVMVYLFQIAMIALVGVLAGLAIGAIAPMIAAQYLVRILPVSTSLSLYPGALGLAALFGVLTALAFAILPLGHTRQVPATALFREQGFDRRGLPSWPYVLATVLTMAALAALAVVTAHDRYLAIIFLAAMAAAFIVLRLVAVLIAFLARHSPRFPSAALRLAIANIHRPGALTPSVTLSLGLGLALLVTLSLIDGNMRRELTGNIPERAPNFFFVDIQKTDLDGFKTVVHSLSPDGKIAETPMLRGRILAFNGVDVTKMEVPAAGRWVLRGDRGITYAQTLPENASLVEGQWWANDYDGEPLVSFSAQEAKELGLKVGDTVSVNVLGRTITAKIANLRKVEWESMSLNFVMVFSPNTFAGAPHAWLATLTDPAATAAQEAAILKSVTNAYPTITSVRVKDALDIINGLVAQLATAIRAAAAIALVSSVLVLSGALAAGNRARTHDAVILKTLGATRAMLIRAFAFEYLILGLVTALFALLAGGVASWFVVSQIMNLPSTFLPWVAVSTLLLSMTTTIVIGLAGTWRILGLKAAPVLREL